MNELLKLFNTIVIYDYNIRVLHWKVVGLDFGTKHELMDDYHSQLNSMIDDIGECILMLHGSIPSLVDIIDNAKNDTDESYTMLTGTETYDARKVIELARKMFTQLISIYQTATTNDSLPGDIVNVLQEHQYWLRKETRYKLDSTLS